MYKPKLKDILDNPRKYCSGKYFKKQQEEFYNYIDKNFTGETFAEKLYRYFYPNVGFCIRCNKPTKFLSFVRGFTPHCSKKCSTDDEARTEHIKQTCQERYGVSNPMKNNTIKEKLKNKIVNKYGGIGLSSPLINEKAKQTKFERYGDQYYTNQPKAHNTIKQKYGRSYGFDYDKIKQTFINKYGCDNPMKSPVISEKTSITRRQKLIDLKTELIGYTENGNWIYKCPHDDCKLKDKCTGYYETKHQIQYDRTKDGNETCTILFPIGSKEKQLSNGSKQYFKQLKQYFPDLITEYKLDRYSLDCYVPSLNADIEYNGYFWHAKPTVYNSNWVNPYTHKTAQQIWDHDRERKEYIESKGIKVITLWEDELLDPEDLYKQLTSNSYIKS